MSKKVRKPDPEEVTLSVKDVSSEARELFNSICSHRNFTRYDNSLSRGEILSDILMKAAQVEFSETGFKVRLETYRERQEYRRSVHTQDKLELDSLDKN